MVQNIRLQELSLSNDDDDDDDDNNNNNNSLRLKAPKGAIQVNYTSGIDWQMAVRRNNVISITLRQV